MRAVLLLALMAYAPHVVAVHKGEPDKNGLYPGVGVLLTIKSPRTITDITCSLTVIAPYRAVTAAHCMLNRKPDVKLVAFFPSVGFIDVAEKFDYPNEYESAVNSPVSPADADLAIVKLTTPRASSLDSYVIGRVADKLTDSPATVVAHGPPKPGVRQYADIRLNTCKKAEPTRNLCWVKVDGFHPAICGGDSGGPLFVNAHTTPVIVGVVSFSSAGLYRRCGPGFDIEMWLTRLSYYQPWIERRLSVKNMITKSSFIDITNEVETGTPYILRDAQRFKRLIVFAASLPLSKKDMVISDVRDTGCQNHYIGALDQCDIIFSDDRPKLIAFNIAIDSEMLSSDDIFVVLAEK